MHYRILIVSLLLTGFAMGQESRPKRISKGDPLSGVYRQLGTPVVEFPLNGKLVQEYKQCTIISCNDVVLSANYKTTMEEPEEPVEEKPPPTIQDIRTSAEQGDPESQFILAYCYQFGQFVTKDYSKAVAWYTKAALQGHASAQHNLGYLYMTGKGVEKDYEKAYKWALLAASNGNDTLLQALDYKLSEEQKKAGTRMAEETLSRLSEKK